MTEREALRAFTVSAVRAAIAAVQPADCIRRFVRLEHDRLVVGSETIDLSKVRRLFVVGMGKASAAMAEALEELLGPRISSGMVVTADGYAVPTRYVEVREAGHPVPDLRGHAAALHVSEVVRGADEGDLVIVLVSGGGSALLASPISGVSLDDLAATNDLLLRAGIPIQELNTVRKHLSVLKGGRLAALAHPARVLGLVLSDVPDDRLEAIASGPTSPDPTTYADVREIVRRASVWDDLPRSVREVIDRGARGEVEETPKPGDVRLDRVSNEIIGSGRIAAEAARAFAEENGFHGVILPSILWGEARAVGPRLAAMAREVIDRSDPIRRPALLVAHGETTVTVVGPGRGGRNQEVSLSATPGIDGIDGVVICSVGTDGRDGPTDAAGGLVDGGTAARLRAAGVRVSESLAENASYEALSASGDLLMTGPTMTNVADIALVAVAAR